MRVVDLGPEEREQERNLVHWVKQMYESSKKAKEPFLKKWEQCYDFYRGKQWPDGWKSGKDKEWRADIVENQIFATVETIIPNYLEANPRAYIYPKNPENEDKALLLEKVKEHIWEATRMRMKLADAGFHVAVYGTSILMVCWDEEKEDLRVEAIAPRNFFPDPDASDIDDAHFVIWARPVSMFEIQRRWPEKYEDIEPEEVQEHLEKPETKVSTGFSKGGIDTPTEKNKTITDEETGAGTETSTSYSLIEPKHKYQRERTVLYEAWIRDLDTKTQRIDPETGEIETTLKYPDGRRIFIAGNTLLEDGPNPYEHGMFPFVKVVNYQLDDSFWAIGDVENLIDPQQEVNKSVSLYADHRNLTLQPHYFVPKGALDGPMSNKPGGTTEYNADRGKPELANESKLPGWLTRFLEGRQLSIQSISGINDSIRGRAPGRVSSGKGIIALQEKDLTRIRKKNANLESAMEVFFLIAIKCALELYEPHTKTLRIAGAGMRDQVLQLPMSDLNIEFEVKVETGSTLPRNPEADQEAITTSMQMGGVTPDEGLVLLEPLLRIPGMAKIMEHKKQMVAMQHQIQQIEAQMQLQQMQQPPPPPEGAEGGAPPDQQMEQAPMGPVQ